MTGKLERKIALVTGGTSGLGLATARRFIAEGATVVITGRRQAELDAAVQDLGGACRGVRGDVSNLADLDRLYLTIAKAVTFLASEDSSFVTGTESFVDGGAAQQPRCNPWREPCSVGSGILLAVDSVYR